MRKQGFTLIELLIVISIIGILSSFAMVSLNSARGKARDALRKADMNQIRTALSLYYDDNGHYPVCGSWSNTPPYGATMDNQGATCYLNGLGVSLTTGSKPYLLPLPKDPSNPTNAPVGTFMYRYVSDSDGKVFSLAYRIESDPTIDQYLRGW